MWAAFCIFVVIFTCVRLVMFCMIPPAPRAPRCYHKMDMRTLCCQNCGVSEPFGRDGNGGTNLEPHPYPERNYKEDYIQNDPYENDSD